MIGENGLGKMETGRDMNKLRKMVDEARLGGNKWFQSVSHIYVD